MTEEVNFTLSYAEEQMKKTILHAQGEMLKIRAGKANPQYAGFYIGRLLWHSNTIEPGC